MKRFGLAALCGVIFGLGLISGGMTDPETIQSFLMPGRDWNPSLMVVLGGAVCVTFAGLRLQKRMVRPWYDARFHLPGKTRIDAHLVLGSILFGIGWGLIGLCPGPAIAAILFGGAKALLFLVSMGVGIALFHGVFSRDPG